LGHQKPQVFEGYEFFGTLKREAFGVSEIFDFRKVRKYCQIPQKFFEFLGHRKSKIFDSFYFFCGSENLL